ncbi:tellurite resistance TerB family protein [Microbacterium arabinogalactanolyticum]|uniref:tellurite resistance TerB family protein n=1 Tax=Microbacterium arabinogalactanolyticum TaxID=69365 RepID=UPI004043DD21
MTHADGTGPNEPAEGRATQPSVEPTDDATTARSDEFSSVDDEAMVEREREGLKAFVSGLSATEIKNGDWFAKLLTLSLGAYTKQVNWEYFQDKYRGVPADVIVDQRIKMATRYAAIEGGLSASAYTGAVVATLGSLGGASPITVPAAIGTLMLDVVFISQLQIRLAYDIAVLYRVPIDIDDPEDLWKLIRVAFTIKSGELLRGGAAKAVPALVRPLLKRFFSGSVLATAKALPVVGKFLLQRNLIKVGIPLVGIPLAVVLNRWTTAIAGRHARAVFRNEARVIEVAERLMERSAHVQLLLWVSWLVVSGDGEISDDEAFLLRHLTRIARERHEVEDEAFANVVNVEPEDVWARIAAEQGDLADIVTAAAKVAEIDGELNSEERQLLDEIRQHCERRTRQ